MPKLLISSDLHLSLHEKEYSLSVLDEILEQAKNYDALLLLGDTFNTFEDLQELKDTFSKKIENLGIQGKSHIIFVIGGSIGLGREVLKRSDYALSFSKMTFPHQLMRVILLEQIYRGYRIMAGEPYHK